MATAHEIAVITNSCIKAPVHPKSGLSTSLSERQDASLSATWQGKQREIYEDLPDFNTKSANFYESQDFGPDLKNLSDAEFYERLVALKEEHKKTLELCERLYSDKLSQLKHDPSVLNTNGCKTSGMSTVSVSRDFSLSPNNSTNFNNRSTEFRASERDFIKDMSSFKPPSGRPKTADFPTRSKSVPKKSAWMTASGSPYGSHDEELFRAGADKSNKENFINAQDDYGHLNDSLNESKYSVHSKISEMWENFSVDDYAPNTKPRPRSASLSRMTSKKNEVKNKPDKEWKHRITIPKPFNMTMREGSNTPKKTKAMIELDERREIQERVNESECQKRFKAKPVPAHVFMPLYDEIMEEKEAKRRANKEFCKELLASQEKPFKFVQREEEKIKKRRTKRSELSDYDNEEKVKFYANPYPSHIFDDKVVDQIKEEEEYRKLKMQMRSEELLKKSSLPPNMAQRGQAYVDGKSRQKLYAEKASKAGFTPEHKFKPNVNPDMPDFDELHRKYMKEVASRKASKESTVCKPFNFKSERIQRKKPDQHRNQYDEQASNYSLKTDLRRNLLSTKTLSTSMDAIPAKMTKSAELRQSANKERLQRKIQNELSELESSRKKRLQEERLKKTINEKAMANDRTVTITKERNNKLREFRESDRARQLEYKSHLNEMKERVDKRPMLFERTAQENAMKAADKRYKETLSRAGLDEEFVNTKGKAASGSAYSGGLSDGNESEEESYMKSYSNRHSTRNTGTKDYSDDYEKGSESYRTQSEGEMVDEEA